MKSILVVFTLACLSLMSFIYADNPTTYYPYGFTTLYMVPENEGYIHGPDIWKACNNTSNNECFPINQCHNIYNTEYDEWGVYLENAAGYHWARSMELRAADSLFWGFCNGDTLYAGRDTPCFHYDWCACGTGRFYTESDCAGEYFTIYLYVENACY